MSVEYAVPVKNILKTWSRGSKLAKKFGKSASTVSAEEALEIAESVEVLQRSLEGHSEAVAAFYKECLESRGDAFAKALVDDKTIHSELKELRTDLMDQINEIQDVADEPEDFEVDIFTAVQKESGIISEKCVKVLEGIRDALPAEEMQLAVVERDDRAGLASMRSRENSTSTVASASTTGLSLRIVTPAGEADHGPPAKPKSAWSIESPTPPYDQDEATATASSSRLPPPPLEELTIISDDPTDFIKKEVVDICLQANDEFLERRKLTKNVFYSEVWNSVGSTNELRRRTVSDIVSPISPLSPTIEVRPIDGRRASSNDYPAFVNGQRGLFLPSDRKRTSTASSQYTASTAAGDRQSMSSHSEPVEEELFGSPEPASNAGSSRDSVALAATLKIPGYGQGVEDGLIAVHEPPTVDYDNEKETVPSDHPNHHPPTPTASMKSIDSPMRHDSSFFKFGGFCEGALISLRGELGYKIAKRPTGTYGSLDYARCLKCSYEVPMSQVEKDIKMDTSGIYGNSGIRWRQRFLTKCHVRTSVADDPIYACVFCIEDRKTTDEHDATIFFSHKQLFEHLSRHPRPLTSVPGINALYGQINPRIVDFDLHFIKNESATSRYNMFEIAPLVQVRPSASAITTYHPKNSRSSSKDPDGNPTLHFAEGARIVGLTFPDRFNGGWCTGYHDGEKGAFPASAIALDLPHKEDILMSAQSSLIAFAKWDFKPRDAREGGWLKFSRGDKITHIGYTFQDQWCWSGQTKNGKWGLFPMAFVEGLQDGGMVMGGGSGSGVAGSISGGASVKSKSGLMGMGLRKFGSRSGSFPIGRSGRSASVKSAGSGEGGSSGGGMGRRQNQQPGLEVVVNGVVM